MAVAFAEPEADARALSPVERLTLDRLLAAIAPLCVPLCGDVRSVAPETPERTAAEAAAYFEVRFGEIGAALGFALSADPMPAAIPSVTLDDLADVEIACAVECARESFALDVLATLREGVTLPLDTPVDDGTLRVAGIAIVRGTCGARGGRAAFAAA
jgi:flagellar motor switch/type III secretory pathway protein FliN